MSFLGLNFGSSWLGVVFNPAGYMLGRKSPSEAASDYIKANPTNAVINRSDTEISFQEDRASWIDKCANKLKSDDVGKTKANCLSACQGVFDSDSNVIAVKQFLIDKAEEEKRQLQEELRKTGQNLITYVGIFLFVGLIIYLLMS